MTEAFPDAFLDSLIGTLSDFLIKKPFLLIAIDGPIASGKSTLARRIWEKTDCFWTGPDDFVDPSVFKDDWSIDEKPFRWSAFKNDFLVLLNRGNKATYQPYDWDKHQMGISVCVEAKGIILVEGMFTLDPDIRDLFDYRIWVQGDSESRMKRLQARETPESYELFLKRWLPTEQRYLSTSQPWQNADLVVAGIDQELSALGKVLS